MSQPFCDTRRNVKKTIIINICLLLVVLSTYLVASHYVKAYSDPVGFLAMAERVLEGEPVTSRAFVYPFVLAAALKVTGPVYVFLSNLPFILCLVLLMYFISKRVATESAGTEGSALHDQRLIGFVATAFLVISNKQFFLEILNPFREPLVFSLMLASLLALLKFSEHFHKRYALASGILLGLAISTRETCVLVIPVVGIWFLYHLVKGSRRAWAGFAIVCAAGLLIGLAPTFIQNFMHSGNVAVPSYAAEELAEASRQQAWDIPIPGMSIHHFDVTSVNSLRYFERKVGWYGLGLLLTGLVSALVRRNKVVWLLLVPSAVMHFLFYSFYSYAKQRYLFVVELFILPIMALGLVELIGLIVRTVGSSRKDLAPLAIKTTAYSLTCVLIAMLSLTYAEQGGRLKVWHVDEMKAHVLPHLEEPFTFLGHRHYNFMLAWHLRGKSEEFEHHFRSELHQLREKGFENVFHSFGTSVVSRVSRGNYYIYNQKPVLLRSWLDFEPAVSFENMPVPVDRYGERLDRQLYHAKTWDQNTIEMNVSTPAIGQPHFLWIDCRRLNDYEGRTYCRVFVNDVLVTNTLGDFAQLLSLPPDVIASGESIVRLESDAPLPAEPYVMMHTIDIPLIVRFGGAPRSWYFSQMSPSLLNFSPLKADSAIVFDEGAIRLPAFAREGRMVYAEIPLEFYQEDPYFKGAPHSITARVGDEEVTVPLPPRRRKAYITIPLGAGTGRLQMVPLELSSTLPGVHKQIELINAGEINNELGLIKLYEVRIFSREMEERSSLAIDIGSDDDATYAADGFHGQETYRESRPVRWTMEKARVRLPLPRPDRAYAFAVRCVEARPEALREIPAFTINGYVVPESQVSEEKLTDGFTQYAFVVEADQFSEKGVNFLGVQSTPWIPSEYAMGKDTRPLGTMIDFIEVRAVE